MKENYLGIKLNLLRSDNGMKFVSMQFNEFLHEIRYQDAFNP